MTSKLWKVPRNSEEQKSERAPLSAADNSAIHPDDEEEGSQVFRPYSDAPATLPIIITDKSDVVINNSEMMNDERRDRDNNADKPIVIHDDGYDSCDELAADGQNYTCEDEFGYSFQDTHSAHSKQKLYQWEEKISRKQHYRTGLLCAYLRHGSPCCGSDTIKRMVMILFYLILLFVMLFCAAAIGYTIAIDGNPFAPDVKNVSMSQENNQVDIKSNTNNSNLENTDDLDTYIRVSGSSDENTVKLVSPPSDIFTVCSDWITSSGRKRCQSLCDLSQCCSLPETDKRNCWKDQADDCATYRSACMALELHSSSSSGSSESDMSEASLVGVIDPDIDTLSSLTSLPAPTSDLNNLCSLASLNTPSGFTACSEACLPSRCCYPDVYDCEVGDDFSKSYCEVYEKPCLNVAESWRGSGHATVGSGGEMGGNEGTVTNQVILKCNAENLHQIDTCIEVCSPGSCCFVSTSYFPIEQLFDKYYGIDRNPIRLTSSCSSNIGFCQQYGSCDHLNHLKDTSGSSSDTYTYELDINGVCLAQYIAQFGALECSNVCQPAHCCFSGEYECDEIQLGHLDCDKYKQCKILYPEDKDTQALLRLAEHIDDVCLVDMIKSLEARAKCQDECKEHLCCFEDGAYGCATDASKNCLAYAGCEVLINTSEPITYDQSESSTGNNIGNEIKSVCNDKVYLVESYFSSCKDMCDNRSCCFQLDPSLSCYEMKQDWCEEYSLCGYVGLSFPSHDKDAEIVTTEGSSQSGIGSVDVTAVKTFNHNPANNLISNMCDKEYLLANGYDGCESSCLPYKCCFVQSDQCTDLSMSNCEEVVLCGNYFTPQEEDLLIEKVCSKEEIFKDSSPCQKICDPYRCCFSDDQCSSRISADCHLYNPCSILFDEAFVSPDNTPNTETNSKSGMLSFNKFCTPSTFKENWNACISHCEPYECCFVKAEYCDKSQSQCNDYSICSEFFGNTNSAPVPTVSSSNVLSPSSSSVAFSDISLTLFNEKCSSPNLMGNWNACNSHCEPYECCFIKAEYCDKSQSQCDDYTICSEFFGNLNSVSAPVPSMPSSMALTPLSSSDLTTSSISMATFIDKCSSSMQLENWNACISHCEPYECCFTKMGSCDKSQSQCDDYSLCSDFFGKSNPVSTTSTLSDNTNIALIPANHEQQTVNNFCSQENIQNNWSVCADLCDPYKCCFVNTGSCNKSRLQCFENSFCADYFQNLNLNSNTSTASFTNIEYSGSGSPYTYPIQSSKGNDQSNDLGYTDIVALAKACNSNQLSKDKTECKVLCEDSACCFSRFVPDNCFDEKKSFCHDHAICESIFDR